MPGSEGPMPTEPHSLLAQQSEIELQGSSKARGGEPACICRLHLWGQGTAKQQQKQQKPLQTQTTLSDSFEESSGSPNMEVEI